MAMVKIEVINMSKWTHFLGFQYASNDITIFSNLPLMCMNGSVEATGFQHMHKFEQ